MKKGFTLAEILIVITILGILSVLTIPSMTKVAQGAKTKAALKKGFAVLTNVYATEFAAKATPVTVDDSDKLIDALKKNLDIKYYLVCNENNCQEEYTAPQTPSWFVVEDNIAYKIVKGEKNCTDKITINQAESSIVATASTCLAVIIDAGCIAKNNSESQCKEIPDGTTDLAAKIKDSKFDGTQMRAFISLTGVAAGNPDTTAAGIITSQD